MKAVGRITLGRQPGDLRQEWKNTKMLAAWECWRSQLWQNMPGAPPSHQVTGTRRPKELQLKEALHMPTSTEELLNQDYGPEVPGCWLTALRRQGTTDCGQASDVFFFFFCVCLCACL